MSECIKTEIHEKMMEEIGTDPDAFCEKVIRLWHASKTLIGKYPESRDNPSDEDLLAWMELNAAANKVVIAKSPDRQPPAVLLMREIISHLAYGSILNGSKDTGRPYGSIALSTTKPNHLFSRMLDVAGVQSIEEAEEMVYGQTIRAMEQRMPKLNI